MSTPQVIATLAYLVIVLVIGIVCGILERIQYEVREWFARNFWWIRK